MRLILVRHGKPESSGDPPAANPPLSPLGHDQARLVGDFLAGEHVDFIVHSGMDRAEQTARPLMDRLGKQATAVTNLGEVDRYGGAYANIETVKAKGDEEWTRFLADPLGYFDIDAPRYIAETLEAFGTLFANNHRKTIAVFTHGFPINILLSHALGLDGVANFIPDYGSISRLKGGAMDRLTVVSINETAHLEAALRRRRERGDTLP